jgi:hypothetical protein
VAIHPVLPTEVSVPVSTELAIHPVLPTEVSVPVSTEFSFAELTVHISLLPRSVLVGLPISAGLKKRSHDHGCMKQ